MKTVKIVHPEAGESEVPESAVPHWRSSGWVPADEAKTEQASGTDGPQHQDGKPSGRSRRRSSEGEQ